mgnify:CR=1 FL=1
MGAPKVPKPVKPPPPPDLAKAQMQALAYAETQRKLQAGSGRRSQFITRGGKSLLGM